MHAPRDLVPVHRDELGPLGRQDGHVSVGDGDTLKVVDSDPVPESESVSECDKLNVAGDDDIEGVMESEVLWVSDGVVLTLSDRESVCVADEEIDTDNDVDGESEVDSVEVGVGELDSLCVAVSGTDWVFVRLGVSLTYSSNVSL